MNDIWHTSKEKPMLHTDIILCGDGWSMPIDIIPETVNNICWKNVEKWCYLDDLLACEKELADTKKKLEMAMKAESKTPVDPYAEQRKWMWHLCRFWFDDKKQADIGILGEIDEEGCYPYCNIDLGHNYKHCEPVKPDDDIIYKGGNNE